MHPVLKWTIAAAGIALTLCAAATASLYLASEAVIERRYPLASTTEPATLAPRMIVRGAHMIAIAGCSDCHGGDLSGRLVDRNGVLPVYATNLRLDAKRLGEDDLERIIRYGVRPDATSLWTMPSGAYTYMSESDIAAIVAYLRTLQHSGLPTPKPQFDFRARLAILEGRLEPAAVEAEDGLAALDLGPRYDGGRYLARVTCGECHGTDLMGAGDAPDLGVVSLYTPPAFFDLLRRGVGESGRRTPVMSHVARKRFLAFADYEIMALYDYLDARTKAPPDLVARAAAARKRAESERERTTSPR